MSSLSYSDFENQYPGYVVISKEGYFYSAHNDSAVILSKVMGYKLGVDKFGRESTGGPNIEKIEKRLDTANYKYIVVNMIQL